MTGQQPYSHFQQLAELVQTRLVTPAEANQFLESFDLRKPPEMRRMQRILEKVYRRWKDTGTDPRYRRQLLLFIKRPTPRNTPQLAANNGLTLQQLTQLTEFFGRRRKALAYLLATRPRKEIVELLEDFEAGKRNPKTVASNLKKRTYRGRRK
jgi:hypothetical protein